VEELRSRETDNSIEIVVATRNRGKLREIKSILIPLPLKFFSLDDFAGIPEVVEDGATFAENAEKKATIIAGLANRPAIADDSGLTIDALEGRPGVYSSRYAGENATDKERWQKVLDEMADVPDGKRQASFKCAVAIASPGGKFQVVEGECPGTIAFKPRGTGGFGYDPIFFLPELGKTMAELDPGVKNRISHRARALEKLKRILPGFLHLSLAILLPVMV